MPVLPYQQQVSLSGGGQEPYAQATPVSGAIGAGIGGISAGVNDLIASQAVHDNAAANDLYATSYSPGARKLLYDPKDGYFTKQGRDALDALPQTEQMMEALRMQARGSLQNENQQRIFDSLARRHYEVEMDGAYRHADRENQVWQAKTSDAVVSDKVAGAVDHFNNPEYVDGAIGGGLHEIQQYGLTHGQSSDVIAERAKAFVRDTRTAVVQRMLVQDPVAAQKYLTEHAGELAGPHMAVIEHQVRQAVLPIESRQIADTVIQAQKDARIAAGAALTSQTGGFDTAVENVLKIEGGYKATDGNSGAPVNFGINQKANPDVDVKNLTKNQAIDIYRKRYWDAIGGDSLPTGVAAMAMDAAVNQGVDFAKSLIKDSGGDVQKMAELRRARYDQIIANDPTQAKNRSSWMARVDQTLTQATRGTTATDLKADMGSMIQQAEALAEEKHPGDPVFRDMAVSQVKGHLNNIVAAQVATQQQYHSLLTGVALGAGKGSQRPGTMDEFLQVPGVLQAFTSIPPESQRGLIAMIDQNGRERMGLPMKSDPAVVLDTFNRIHLPDDDPQKIRYKDQLAPLLGKLGKDGYEWLGKEVDQQQSVSGRSLTKDLQNVRTSAQSMLLRSPLGGAQPELATEASYRFSLDMQNQVDAAIKAGKDPRALLTPGTKEYLLNPERVVSFLQTPQQAVAAQARAVASSARQSAGKVSEPPARVASDAEYAALPSGAQFIGPDGKVRIKP